MVFDATSRVAQGSAVNAWLHRAAGASPRVMQVTRPELRKNEKAYDSFLSAARRALELKHPSLLTAESGSWLPDGRLALYSAPVTGRTAADVVARLGSLPPAIVLAWGDALSEALACLHEHGIVHGHVSPKNIFLGEDEARPHVRLLDTQLLLFRGHGCVAAKGTLVGAEYLAPERILRQRGTEQSDVYALGVTLFELLMGRPPFRGKSVGETRLMHLRTPPPWLPESLSAFTPVIHGCLAKHPEERFPTALDVREALRGVTLAA